MDKQLVIIEKAGDNYSAYSPCINGCIATGNTEEEVLKNFVEALVLHASGLQKWLDDSLTEISQLQTKITPISEWKRERKRRKYHEVIYKDNYAIIICNSDTHGQKEVLVDTDMAEKISEYTWYIDKNKISNDVFYAFTNCGKKKISMHRLIMGSPANKMIDHINHNGLDNRKQNLKICTNMINQRNRKVSKNSKSGVIGVNWHPKDNLWSARIKVNQKNISLGYFKDIQEAIKVRKEAEREYWND